MTTLTLGRFPEDLLIPLARDGDFDATLALKVAGVATDWPASTVLSIVFPATTWVATIAGANAVFSVDKALVNAMDDSTPATLLYVNGTTDRVLAEGKAKFRG